MRARIRLHLIGQLAWLATHRHVAYGHVALVSHLSVHPIVLKIGLHALWRVKVTAVQELIVVIGLALSKHGLTHLVLNLATHRPVGLAHRHLGLVLLVHHGLSRSLRVAWVLLVGLLMWLH